MLRDDSFILRPTEVLEQYLVAQGKGDLGRVRRVLTFGRLAMALEIVTTIRTLEQHSLLIYSPQETISVLQTLLQDQELAEQAVEWYELLAEWRKPKFEVAEVDVDAVLDAAPSELEALEDAPALHGRRFSLPYTDQTKDPPSSS